MDLASGLVKQIPDVFESYWKMIYSDFLTANQSINSPASLLLENRIQDGQRYQRGRTLTILKSVSQTSHNMVVHQLGHHLRREGIEYATSWVDVDTCMMACILVSLFEWSQHVGISLL